MIDAKRFPLALEEKYLKNFWDVPFEEFKKTVDDDVKDGRFMALTFIARNYLPRVGVAIALCGDKSDEAKRETERMDYILEALNKMYDKMYDKALLVDHTIGDARAFIEKYERIEKEGK